MTSSTTAEEGGEKPRRIQLRRTKGFRLQEIAPSAVKVDRSTKWGNPFDVGDKEPSWRSTVVEMYRGWMREPAQTALRAEAVVDLRGKPLACWCPLPEPGKPDHCHAAHLLELANAKAPSMTEAQPSPAQGEPEWTSGPWRVEDWWQHMSESQRAEEEEKHPNWREVCGGTFEDKTHFSVSGHIGEANARLIAAAPDLYAALKDLLTACEIADDLGELYDLIDGEKLDAASAALALAERGKS